jgi:hypothetical protein
MDEDGKIFSKSAIAEKQFDKIFRSIKARNLYLIQIQGHHYTIEWSTLYLAQDNAQDI